MENYLIEKVNLCGYDIFVLCLSIDSIVNYLDELESEPEMIKASGKLLVDNLLVTGNEYNRFVSCNFYDGKLDLSTAKLVTPDERFRSMTTKLLSEHFAYVENSILSKQQRESIKKGIAL